jgi:hypothetical protein
MEEVRFLLIFQAATNSCRPPGAAVEHDDAIGAIHTEFRQLLVSTANDLLNELELAHKIRRTLLDRRAELHHEVLSTHRSPLPASSADRAPAVNKVPHPFSIEQLSTFDAAFIAKERQFVTRTEAQLSAKLRGPFQHLESYFPMVLKSRQSLDKDAATAYDMALKANATALAPGTLDEHALRNWDKARAFLVDFIALRTLLFQPQPPRALISCYRVVYICTARPHWSSGQDRASSALLDAAHATASSTTGRYPQGQLGPEPHSPTSLLHRSHPRKPPHRLRHPPPDVQRSGLGAR